MIDRRGWTVSRTGGSFPAPLASVTCAVNVKPPARRGLPLKVPSAPSARPAGRPVAAQV